jgi:F0F1-type ATP synthase membrane subunit b/b'
VFEARVDTLCREIGDRGKPQLNEAVPPEPAPAPRAWAPAPAPAPTPAPITAPAAAAPAPAPASSPGMTATQPYVQGDEPLRREGPSKEIFVRRYSVQQPPPSAQVVAVGADSSSGTIAAAGGGGGGGGNFEEMIRFMREERLHVEAKLEQQQQMKEERAAMEAKIEQERAAMEAKIEQIRSEQGLSALQTRLEALHAAKLLSDDERDIIEDKIADSVEGGDDSSGDDTVSQMVALSSKMVVDRAFSRQLRRKWTR